MAMTTLGQTHPAQVSSWTYSPDAQQHTALVQLSHERSSRFGLSAIDRPDFSAVSKADFHAALEQNRFLFQHAAPYMESLYEQIANTHSMVLLTSKDGLILHSLGDNDFLEKASQVALTPGMDWSEQSKGTNAIGTALTEERPLVIHGKDHYLRANHFLTCSCTPIFDPHGKVIGALDVTGDERSFHMHTMALTRMSAQLIENQMFSNVFSDEVRIHFHARQEFLGTLAEGIVVFNKEGRFLAANRSAQFQLGYGLGSLQAQTFTTLFGESMPQFLQRLRTTHHSGTMLRLNTGLAVWCEAKLKPLNSWMGGGVGGAPWDTESDRRQWVAPQFRDATAGSEATASARSRSALRQRLSGLHYLDTGDRQMSAVVRKLQMVIDRDIPIMILGETGTGKDILAQAIHNDSARASKPFVSVNCASIPESLIESELFGYEEGAFTGARRKGSAGKILQANGGTLFLDEIGDMPTQLQARLLRVLQERRVTPLGSTKEYEVDVTVVCATHRDLKAAIARGDFREDLYYRLNGLVVKLPALRERSDFDIVVRRLLDSLCQDQTPVEISGEVLDMLRRYHWPGNFRQLHNVLRTAVALVGRAQVIEKEHLPDDFLDEMEAVAVALLSGGAGLLPTGAPAVADAPVIDPTIPPVAGPTAPVHATGLAAPGTVAAHLHSMQDVALKTMADALRQCHGNVSAAAKLLGVSRNTIYRKKDALPPDVWQ